MPPHDVRHSLDQPNGPSPATGTSRVDYYSDLPAGIQPNQNTSGQDGPLPPEVEALRWNWGAFLGGWLWPFFHGLPSWGFALIVISVVRLVVRIMEHGAKSVIDVPLSMLSLGIASYLGSNGHALAWRKRHFPGGVPQFLAVQRAWSVAGIWTASIGAVVLVAVIVVIVASDNPVRVETTAIPIARPANVPGDGATPDSPTPTVYNGPPPAVRDGRFVPGYGPRPDTRAGWHPGDRLPGDNRVLPPDVNPPGQYEPGGADGQQPQDTTAAPADGGNESPSADVSPATPGQGAESLPGAGAASSTNTPPSDGAPGDSTSNETAPANGNPDGQSPSSSQTGG
jgi:hypothetical protein